METRDCLRGDRSHRLSNACSQLTWRADVALFKKSEFFLASAAARGLLLAAIHGEVDCCSPGAAGR